MSKAKPLIWAAVIFAALAAARLLPEYRESLEESVFPEDIDYREVFLDISRLLSPEESVEDCARAAGESMAVISFAAAEYGTNSGEAYIPVEVPAVVAAFLESQEPYASEPLPDSVSYDYIELPWESCVPVAGYKSSGFGWRIHPIKGELRFHYGSDFAAWTGEDILAFAEGVVSYAGPSDSFGNYIIIEHPEGWQSLYAHCSKLLVSSGDSVEAGQTIALVGETGLATGPHLHFELSREGVYVNPEYYVN